MYFIYIIYLNEFTIGFNFYLSLFFLLLEKCYEKLQKETNRYSSAKIASFLTQ